MGKLIDLTGQRFGRLTVIERVENDLCGQVKWHCKCDCGEETDVQSNSLRNGRVRSCGCLLREKAAEQCRISFATHHLRHSRLYPIWVGMKGRCYNLHNKSYPRYGGRGITVCNEWLHNFQAFYDWAMVNGYRDDLSIDRIDVNGNYEPSNCRWATMKEQQNNRSTNRIITIGNKTKTLKEWCEQYGLDYKMVHKKITVLGWTPEEALELVPRKKS